jgi:hypothetical protein
MTIDDILAELRALPAQVYGYAILVAIAGPLALRSLGLRSLAPLVRPAAIMLVLAGMYAKQERPR